MVSYIKSGMQANGILKLDLEANIWVIYCVVYFNTINYLELTITKNLQKKVIDLGIL